MLEPGQIVERYQVETLLGEGGMAAVYRVRHTTLGTPHALKVLTLTNKKIRERLITEGRVQATLQHPHAVAVQDVFEVDGTPCLLMEYVDGPDLGRWIEAERYDLQLAEQIFRGVVSAVDEAHRRGLVHRDLKPANVLMARIGDEWVPKVADFGLAKLVLDSSGQGSDHGTRTGVTMGTPAYMAPEQIRDAKNVDQRADVFSLGCILYELVTRRQPFVGDDIVELFTAVTDGTYAPPRRFVPDLPAHLERTIVACLEVDPDRRPASCEAVLALLDRDAPAAPAAAPAAPDWSPPPRKGLIPALMALPFVVLLVGGGSTLLVGGAATWWFVTRTASVVEEAVSALPCGGRSGQVVGYLLGGKHPFFSRAVGTTWELGSERVVATDHPREENGMQADETPVCTLPRGTVLTVVHPTIHVRGSGVWVPVVADAIELPDSPGE